MGKVWRAHAGIRPLILHPTGSWTGTMDVVFPQVPCSMGFLVRELPSLGASMDTDSYSGSRICQIAQRGANVERADIHQVFKIE